MPIALICNKYNFIPFYLIYSKIPNKGNCFHRWKKVRSIGAFCNNSISPLQCLWRNFFVLKVTWNLRAIPFAFTYSYFELLLKKNRLSIYCLFFILNRESFYGNIYTSVFVDKYRQFDLSREENFTTN